MSTNSNKRNLTTKRIVAEAGLIVRHEDADALTMRRLAEACGVTPMALYHHVSDKDEVLELVLGEVLGEALVVDLHGDPRHQLLDFTDGLYRVMVQNPGVGRLFTSRGITVPNMALITERFFELLDQCGIAGHAAAEALDAIVLHLVGGVAYTLSRPPGVRKDLLKGFEAEKAPLLTELVDYYSARDPDAQFRWGLERLLEGIEASLST